MDVTPAFRGSEAIASGRLTRGQLRGPGYLSLFRDVYVRAGQRLDLEARSRASTLFLPSGGALAGHSAAALWRAGCSPAEADVEFAVPGGTVRAQPGLVVHRGALNADEVTMRSGVPVTTPCGPRTTSAAARHGSKRSSVSTHSLAPVASHPRT